MWLFHFLFCLHACLVQARAPSKDRAPGTGKPSPSWLGSILRQGNVPFGNDTSYKVFRNVREYGAVGDGMTDDTEAINLAVSDGHRCGEGCDSQTTTPAIVYFPPGKYAVSAPIIQYYYSQFIGDALDVPTIVALPDFQGIAVVDTDPYIPGGNGAQWYTNQNNFFRQMRNFIIDMTLLPEASPEGNAVASGIHWQVAQATSLQNIVFNMLPKSPTNKQQGIFMDNGSGGLMIDLVFNGGNIGAFLGNQQFTTRNWTFNNVNTAVYMNWNWLWTFKGLKINNCDVGLNMSNLNTTSRELNVGSIIIMDSEIKNARVGVWSAYSMSSVPATAGTLLLHNVNFTNTGIAVTGEDGQSQILAGGGHVDFWGQGNKYEPAQLPPKKNRPRQEPPALASPASPATVTVYSASIVSTACETLTIYESNRPGPPDKSDLRDQASSGFTNETSTRRPHGPPWLSWTDTLATVPTGRPGRPTKPLTLHNETRSVLAPTGWPPSSTETPTTSNPESCAGSSISLQSTRVQQGLTSPTIPTSLLRDGMVFERSKPQYENYGAASFVSVKSAGAKGDGVTDDSDAIQDILDAEAGQDKIVYFDHGAYVITKTIKVPKDIKIMGEMWPLILAKGDAFADVKNPRVFWEIGESGDVGSVEISDLMFETVGPLPGAIMMQWNVAEEFQGSVGMWDVHFRIGGSAGTDLQYDRCPAQVEGSYTYKPECSGAFLLFHMTQESSGYFENCWFWIADHELDYGLRNRTNIYNGRGVLIESQGPTWLWGTSSEHHQLYNYQLAGAKDVFMATIQTETAYMQSAPNALNAGFTPEPAFKDPDFADCTSDACKKTWGLRIVESESVFVYGAGLYSFFENYDQECLETNSCQENMVEIVCSQDINLYGVTSKAATNIVRLDGYPAAMAVDNLNLFGQTLLSFET